MGNFVNFFMPLLIAAVADFGSDEAALFLCAACSFAGLALSLPLMKRFPGKVPEVLFTPEEQAHMDSDDNWVDAAKLVKVNRARMAEGKANLRQRWGDFNTSDKDYLPLLNKVARRDFISARKHITEVFEVLNGGGESAKKLSGVFKAREEDFNARFEAGEFDEDAKEMGLWMARYFHYAAHDAWNQYPTMYKQIIMATFPPFPRAGPGTPPAFVFTRFLGWLDNELELLEDDPFRSYSMLGKFHALKLH